MFGLPEKEMEEVRKLAALEAKKKFMREFALAFIRSERTISGKNVNTDELANAALEQWNAIEEYAEK